MNYNDYTFLSRKQQYTAEVRRANEKDSCGAPPPHNPC